MQNNITKTDDIFSRQDTKIIKGFAVFMMLLHHLWSMPERYLPETVYHMSGIVIPGTGQDFLIVLGMFGKVCVPLFMFLGGYGLWHKMQKKYCLAKDIIGLYRSFWKVAVIFIPIGLLFFSHQPDYMAEVRLAHIFEDHRISTIISNLMGTATYSTHIYNLEWWFFLPYLVAMTIGCIMISVDKIHHFWTDAFYVLVFEIVTRDLLPIIVSIEPFSQLNQSFWFQKFFLCNEFTSSFLMGIIFAKYNALVRLRHLYRQRFFTKVGRLLGGAVGLSVLFWYKKFLFPALDVLYTPFLVILVSECLRMIPLLQKFFELLGKHSTNIWLTHSFYCYYFGIAVKLILISRNAYISLATLVALSLVTAIALDKFWELISSFHQHIKRGQKI